MLPLEVCPTCGMADSIVCGDSFHQIVPSWPDINPEEVQEAIEACDHEYEFL